MERLTLNRFIGLGLFFGACAVASVLLFQPLLLALPFFLVGFLWVAHQPSLLYYFLVAAIPWSIEYNFTSTLGTDLPTEPLMLLLSFSTLCYLVYEARNRPLAGFFRSPLLVLLLLQAAWWLVATLFSTDFTRSIKFFIAKSWYLGAFVVAPYVLFRNPKALVRTAQVLSVSMLLLVARTMIRHAGYRFTFERINDSLWPNFRNHVNYSSVLVCVIPILVAAYVLMQPGLRRKLLVGVLALAAAALVLSYARGAWLALVAGGVLFWMLRRKMLLRGYLVVLLGAGLSLYALIDNDRYMKFAHDHDTTTFHTNFSEHLQATYQFKDVSTAERFYRWIAGVRMIEQKWVTGWGPQTFSQNYQRYTIPAFRTWVSDNKDQSTVHNYYLTTVIEQGAAGLLILLVFIGYALHAGQRIYHEARDPLWRAAAAVAAVVLGMQCTFNALNDLVETDKLGSLFYLAIAVLIAGEVHLRRQSEQDAAADAP